MKRRDATRQQVQSLSAEHESLKKQLAGNEADKELEETEKRLRHYERCPSLPPLFLPSSDPSLPPSLPDDRTIFDLREFIESKTRETDYELAKGNCLRVCPSHLFPLLSSPSLTLLRWWIHSTTTLSRLAMRGAGNRPVDPCRLVLVVVKGG